MGTWPTRYGNETGSLPPGLTLPNTTSATGGPACTPGNHASRSAGASSTTSSSASGRPLNSTTATGLPVALIARSSSSWRPGRSRVLRAAASPLISRVSPRASTTWSAAFATSTASAKPASDWQPSGVVGRRLGVGELAALRVGGAGALLADAVEDAHRVVVAADAPPRSEHVVLVLGQRPDHRRLLAR